MSNFTEKEIAYLSQQRLGRLATVGNDSQPHVVPVGYRYDAGSDTIQIGGFNFSESKKFRDVERNPQVALVIDDVPSIDPWQARGIEIRGTARAFREGGESLREGFDAAWLQIKPKRIVSWGIESNSRRSHSRSVS